MTIKEYRDLLKYVAENNSWRDIYNVTYLRRRNAVKYVDCSFDTRTFNIWSVSFRGCNASDDIAFGCDNDSDLEKIYEWLNKDIKEF